ncbi:hypothetical protein [Oscillibacter sp.]|uniref:hypothetical protein n=1 Tax=Oscillibacter sp. TaxID=1945593 RepID=UPI00289F12A0|nr:hypothetical protein [Oscillibacter sp.]
MNRNLNPDNTWSILKDIVKTHKIESTIIAAVTVIGLVCFQYGDGLFFTGHAVEIWDALMSGRIKELPDIFVANYRGAPHGGLGLSSAILLSLMPWAIWNFPVWLTHPIDTNPDVFSLPCLIWGKLLFVLCVVLLGVQVYRIVYSLTDSKSRGQLAAILLWGSGTIALSVGYGMQDEVLYTLLFVVGLRYILKEKRVIGLICMGYSVVLAPFMILPAFLVLLWMYKNLLIVGAFAGCFLAPPFLLAKSISLGYSSVDDDYLSWFFERSTLGSGYGAVSIFGVLVCLTFIFSYFSKEDEGKKNHKRLLNLLAVLMTGMCVLAWLHFYRVFLCVPFLLIGILSVDEDQESKIKIGMIGFLAFEFIRMLCPFLYQSECMNTYSITGITKVLLGITSECSIPMALQTFFPVLIEVLPGISMAIASLAIFMLCLIYMPSAKKLLSIQLPVRVLTIINCLIPFVIFSGFLLVSARMDIYQIAIDGNDATTPDLAEVQSIDQHYFEAAGKTVNQIGVRTVTWGNSYPGDVVLCLEVLEKDSLEVIETTRADLNSLPNNDIYYFHFDNFRLNADEWYIYRFKLEGNLAQEISPLVLLHSDEGSNDSSHSYVCVEAENGPESQIMEYQIIQSMYSLK